MIVEIVPNTEDVQNWKAYLFNNAEYITKDHSTAKMLTETERNEK